MRHTLMPRVRSNKCFTGWRRINRTIYFCCPCSVFLQQQNVSTIMYVYIAPSTFVKAVLNVSSTGCNNNERQSFAKLPYSPIDNVLTNLFPAGLQDFLQVLKVSMTVKKRLECPQMEQSTGFKSGLLAASQYRINALPSLVNGRFFVFTYYISDDVT